jgi:hypothetical protein
LAIATPVLFPRKPVILVFNEFTFGKRCFIIHNYHLANCYRRLFLLQCVLMRFALKTDSSKSSGRYS